MQKLAQQGWIEINENEAKLTSAGADRLSELHTEYTGLRFDRYGRTGETSWRLIKFAVQVISNLASGNQIIFQQRQVLLYFSTEKMA